MNIEKYLTRLNMTGNVTPDLQTLKQLHKNHLLNIPFENLDIHYGETINLDVKFFYQKIIENKRGGFCYELNGLFYELLKELGFQVRMLSARVNNNGAFGPEFDHMAILVQLQDQWLADVGFGDSFLEPIKIEIDKKQFDNDKIFKIVHHQGDYLGLVKSDDGIDFNVVYIFTLQERKLDDFTDMCHYHQTSGQSHFTRNKVCTIALPNGRLTITNSKLIKTENGKKVETVLNDETEFLKQLYKNFGIKL